jgi:YVTN family beta-propeller protein
VSNSGNGTISGEGSIAVVDTATGTVTATIALGGDPRDSAVTPDGSTLYVADHTQGVVYAISTATNTVTAVIGLTGTFPAGLAISPDGSAVYVANNGTANVSVISTSSNSITGLATGFSTPRGITTAPH